MNDEQKQQATILREKGISYGKIGETINASYDQVRGYLRYSPLSTAKGKIVYEDKKSEPTTIDINAYWEALKCVDNAINDLDTKQTKTIITINDIKPIGIAFWGDWHLGARGIDYEAFEKDQQTIKETDGLYVIGMGDYKDNQNAFVHASGTLEQVATPGMQDMLVKRVWQDVADSSLAIIRGCHDDWDKKLGDKDFVATLCAKDVADCVNLWHGGSLAIKLGSQTYKIRARHKYKGESDLNTTNSQRRMVDSFGAADVNAVAHRHYSEIQQTTKQDQETVYLRSGSYKYYDEFGQKIGGYRAILGVPVVIFFPDTKRMIGFRYMEDAILVLKSLRENVSNA